MREIIGHDQARAAITEAIRLGRAHHAWIFSGPRGVGKCTTALAAARLLLDPDTAPNLAGELEASPDGPCAALLDAGTHPDLHVVRKELALFSDNAQLRSRKLTNIPLDVLREHILGGRTSDDKQHEAPAYRTAVMGHAKVFIIDEAELIDANGQNALLKTLEEPPPRTYFFLITSRPDRLLATIHSRCHHVAFGRLSDDELQTWLQRADLGLDDAARTWITEFSDGAPGAAQLAAEYDFYGAIAGLEPLLRRAESGQFPPELGETMAGFIEQFAVNWVKKNKNASKDAANKDGARQLLGLLASRARGHLAEGGAPERWAQTIELINDAEVQLESNVNLKQALENLAAQWTVGADSR